MTQTVQLEIRPEIRIVDNINNDDILQWLQALRLKAYAAGSSYKVAAILAMRRADDYVLVGGVNVECLDHRHGTHGESSAVSALATILGKNGCVDEVWTLGSPKHLTGPSSDPLADQYGFTCGDCRQHLNDVARRSDIPVNSFTLNGEMKTRALDQLLPDSFSFANIDSALLAAKNASVKTNNSDLVAMGARILRHEKQSSDEIFKWMSSLESIDYSSKQHQAVILKLSNGSYVAGVKVENAAYVGLSAMQGVLGNAVTIFGEEIAIKEIYTLSRTQYGDNDLAYPLTLSGIQTLNEFIKSDHKDIPVTMFTPAGNHATISLAEAAGLSTSFAAPAYRLDQGKLKHAA